VLGRLILGRNDPENNATKGLVAGRSIHGRGHQGEDELNDEHRPAIEVFDADGAGDVTNELHDHGQVHAPPDPRAVPEEQPYVRDGDEGEKDDEENGRSEGGII
jgi:hypothetical protein